MYKHLFWLIYHFFIFLLKTDNNKSILIDESEEKRLAKANSILSKLAGGQDTATATATATATSSSNKTDEPSTALNPKLFQPKYYFDQYEELILRPEGIFSRIGMFKFQLGYHIILINYDYLLWI